MLAGIQQSTIAHELLHAVWARLDDDARSELAKEIREIYAAHQDALAKHLTNYEEPRWNDELHAIIGTEFAELPDTLAQHYAKYFADHTKIIGYFNAYNSKFQALRLESENLRAQIDALKATIASETTKYENGANQLNADIADFRRRAESGFFTGRTDAFYREQASLQSRSNNLTVLYNQVNRQIGEVNNLIDHYNQNAAALTDLNDSITSPVAPPSI